MTESSAHHSLWVPASLFLVTALASQVIHNRRRQQERQEQQLDETALGHRYSMKRMGLHALSRQDLKNIVKQELKVRKGEVDMESVRMNRI